jgi:regulator of protease activity HflC (stomatin/prohibitin superfamily)
MRSVLGQSELDELLSKREEINQRLQEIIDEQTAPWGIKVSIVEVKDVELPQEMKRAMARQAEAERDKRAKVIHAEGEFLAAQQLANAANIINAAPSALQLRYLQALSYQLGSEPDHHLSSSDGPDQRLHRRRRGRAVRDATGEPTVRAIARLGDRLAMRSGLYRAA